MLQCPVARRSAYSVIQVWRLAGDRYFLLDQFRERIDFTGLRDEVRYFRKKYRPVAILIERAANGYALISDLTRKYPQLIRPIDPDGRSKSSRLLTHAATILSKRVHLPAVAPWREEFVKEFCGFPKGKYSDQVDATTQFLDHASEFAARHHSLLANGLLPPPRRVDMSPLRPHTEASAGSLASPDMAGQLDRHRPKVRSSRSKPR